MKCTETCPTKGRCGRVAFATSQLFTPRQPNERTESSKLPSATYETLLNGISNHPSTLGIGLIGLRVIDSSHQGRTGLMEATGFQRKGKASSTAILPSNTATELPFKSCKTATNRE